MQLGLSAALPLARAAQLRVRWEGNSLPMQARRDAAQPLCGCAMQHWPLIVSNPAAFPPPLAQVDGEPWVQQGPCELVVSAAPVQAALLLAPGWQGVGH